MHVLIITDLEGVSCVDSIEMINEQNEGYQRAREYLMADTNAAIDGAFIGGATKVTVLDGHGGGRNFIPGQLDPRAVLMPVADFCYKPLSGFDALICVGAHAMAGTPNAFLDHTEDSTRWFEYCINGKPEGEMGEQAYTVGAFSTPFVMASGDAAACREAEAMVPGVATACVKEAVERNKAKCLPLEEAVERIRAAAADGVRRAKEIPARVLPLPAELKLTHTRNDYCDEIMKPGLVRNGRTVTKIITSLATGGDLIFF